jgi:hypothetical protein
MVSKRLITTGLVLIILGTTLFSGERERQHPVSPVIKTRDSLLCRR